MKPYGNPRTLSSAACGRSCQLTTVSFSTGRLPRRAQNPGNQSGTGYTGFGVYLDGRTPNLHKSPWRVARGTQNVIWLNSPPSVPRDPCLVSCPARRGADQFSARGAWWRERRTTGAGRNLDRIAARSTPLTRVSHHWNRTSPPKNTPNSRLEYHFQWFSTRSR